MREPKILKATRGEKHTQKNKDKNDKANQKSLK